MQERNTQQKKLIYDILSGMGTHPTADEVYEQVRKSTPSVGRATVYRVLGKMAESGRALKISTGQGADHFDHRTDNHFHVQCTVCGRVEDVELAFVPELEKLVSDSHGFRITGHSLTFSGVCPECVGEDVIVGDNCRENIFQTDKGEKIMKKFVCKVCGYIATGDAAPEFCPVCKAKSTMFEEVKGELELAAEHKYGIYAQTVKDNPDVSDEDKAYILEQLKANFNGECSEVGMYLCMARIAHREGYPEIGLYWEKAAYEEAEHAAKFAELLGEELEPNMKATTKDNLAWRVECEFGATAGKVELATCAKKNGLDAIHDTVHEMARDEARHGKALKGLLERYFAKELARERVLAAANKTAEVATDAATKVVEKAGEAVEKIGEMLKK